MKIIKNILKKIIFGFVILYSFNIIMQNADFIIPINVFTIITTSLLGFPGLFSLVIVSLLI